MDESIFDNPWFVAPALTLLVIVTVVLLFVYLPRADEIKRLKKRIRELREKVDSMSRQQTKAELEHVADMEQIRGDRAADAKEFAEKLQGAEEQKRTAEARTEQSEDLRRQIAEAAEKMQARRATA